MFSSASKYAIRSVLFLAVNSDEDKKWGAIDIAKELDIKQPFLAKTLQELVRNNIVSSVKGPKGGFYLSEENRGNNLLRILDCFDDLDPFQSCVLGLPECSNEKPCPLHIQAFAYREGMRYQFIHLTIEDLAKKVSQLELSI